MKQKSIHSEIEGCLIGERLEFLVQNIVGLSVYGKALKTDGCFQPFIPRTSAEIEACIEARVNPPLEGGNSEIDLRGELLETIQETQLPIDIDLPTVDLQYQLRNHLNSRSPEELFLMGIFGRPASDETLIRSRERNIEALFRNMKIFN